MADAGTCNFCKQQLTERKGGLSILGPGADIFEELKQASARKFVCPSCSSIFCLDCGNKKGYELKTGSTHCPKCGKKVL
jgi:DNA-directed RNA polymerase subunit RPC12/RpoP